MATGVPCRFFRLLVIRAMVGVAALIVFVAVTLNAKRTLRSRSVKTISVLVVVPAIVSVVESIGAAVPR